jgi:hypothetical protein
MEFLEIANLIIPGYKLLSQTKRDAFEQSEPGKAFYKSINTTLKAFRDSETQSTLLERFWWMLTKSPSLQEHVELKKTEILNDINVSNEYRQILIQISLRLLKKVYPDFRLLNKNQQETLAGADFSLSLLNSHSEYDRLIEKDEREYRSIDRWAQLYGSATALIDFTISEITDKKQTAIIEWERNFLESPEMENLRNSITLEKARQKWERLTNYAKELVDFFPFLNYRISLGDQSTFDKLVSRYDSEIDKTENRAKINEELISDILFHYMQEVNRAEMSFINLDDFNHKRAKRMADAILKAFKRKSLLDLDALFNKYNTKLNTHLIDQAYLINDKAWERAPVSNGRQLLHSLSFLWNNKAVDVGNQFLGKFADAHAFIQATNFSTQNESSFLAILDFYNYGRYHQQISEVKTIFASLLNPFKPLYNEYKEIGLYEKNAYWKAFRTLMPILIVVGFIIVVAALLAPLALPELAFTAALIPILLIGLGLATKYVTIKNDLYKYVREKYYGGHYEIPEFLCNERMNHAFGNENAELIRKFYIKELTRCEKLESEYQSKNEKGLLSADDIQQREQNNIKRTQLCLEWYDIHSNKDLHYEEVPQIALNRLQLAGDKCYEQLEQALQSEQNTIRLLTTQVTDEIKNTIVSHNSVPADPRPEATTIRTNYRHGLFSIPQTYVYKTTLEEIATLKDQISAAL